MRGWIAAAVFAGCWAATCVESRRRWEEDGKALAQAAEGFGRVETSSWSGRLVVLDEDAVARAVASVNAALEARA